MNTSTERNFTKVIKSRRFAELAIGIFAIIASGVLAYLAIVLPLLAASRHEEDVSVSAKCIILVPGLLLIGIISIFMGDRASDFIGTREKPSKLGLILCIGTAVIGILLSEWLNSKLRSYGYKV
jgi:hypothetical protein